LLLLYLKNVRSKRRTENGPKNPCVSFSQ